MTLQEAIKSGKRFKRPYWNTWHDRSSIGRTYICAVSILADDWEIEEKKVEVSRHDIDAAFRRLLPNVDFTSIRWQRDIDDFCEYIGLED